MRAAFASTLVELAERDGRILLLTGDLGFRALEPFSDRFPERFFNVGVAEQNMLGLATGLAESGFLPFVYSIATFASLRAYEFIRNGPVAHGLPVRIVGMGGGFEYGAAGISHHSLEDVGVMRLQPGLTVLAPCDPGQTRSILRETFDRAGPVYYRLGKYDHVSIDGLGGRFRIGRSEIVREGKDVLVLASGAVTAEALAACHELGRSGIQARLAVVSTLNPAPVSDLRHHLARFPLAVTVEAHYLSGGLGSVAAEVIAEGGLPCRLLRLGVAAPPDGVSGSLEFLLRRHGLSRDKIAASIARALAP
jgi:transketolase